MKRDPSTDFNAFTIKFAGHMNRIITDIGITPAFDPAAPPSPPYTLFKTTALWDTGATGSVITVSTVASMNLVPVGRTMVNHAGGSSESNTYMVNMVLPNNVGVSGVQVTEAKDVAGSFGAIIGMDIISQSDLAITNVGGETWMTFRIPSVGRIDYVVEANRIKFAGVAGNAPCPCGSGKKFKQCHGAGVA